MKLKPVFPMPEIWLYHNEKKCLKALEGFDIEVEPPDPYCAAQTWSFGDIAIVFMNTSLDWHTDASLLCHEASHITEAWLDWIGEEDPAPEERAYMIQCISETLFRAHEAWKRRKTE